MSTFAACNLVLAAINFLPAIPFDGGLILQEFAVQRWGSVKGKEAALWTSLALLAAMVGL